MSSVIKIPFRDLKGKNLDTELLSTNIPTNITVYVELNGDRDNPLTVNEISDAIVSAISDVDCCLVPGGFSYTPCSSIDKYCVVPCTDEVQTVETVTCVYMNHYLASKEIKKTITYDTSITQNGNDICRTVTTTWVDGVRVSSTESTNRCYDNLQTNTRQN